MGRFASLLYGAAAYGAAMLTIVYAVGFVTDLVVPKSIDSGVASPLVEALVVDTLLLGIFAVQHSVMARPAFKKLWTRIVPEPIERSTYVLFATLSLVLLFWQWRSIPAVIWLVTDPVAVTAIQAMSLAGFALVVFSTFLISHFELFGLTQVLRNWLNRQAPEPLFRTPLLYRHVRHPLYLGFLIAFWAAPTMTAGHLLFALATTGYIVIAIQLEERDLIQFFGTQYVEYRKRVSMLIPGLGSLPTGANGANDPSAAPSSPARVG
jgi:protein-S-isoprenylcysteine O-methyltransferase Ste14